MDNEKLMKALTNSPRINVTFTFEGNGIDFDIYHKNHGNRADGKAI